MLLCHPILAIALVGAHAHALVVASDATTRGGIVAAALSLTLLIVDAALFFASDDF